MVFKAPDGGAAENVVQLVQRLGHSGWEVELAGPLRASVYDRVPASIRVHRLPITSGYGTVREVALALRGLRSILRGGRFDLLHVHSAQASVLARLARLAGGPPVVYTPHCYPFLANTTRLRSVAALSIERSLAPLTAAFIDVSEYERAAAIHRHVGRPERHHLVLNASDPRPDLAPDAQLVAFRKEGPLIVVVTSLRVQKRVDVFLRALPRVFRETTNARAAVIGDGPESASLRELADGLGLGEGGRLLMLPFEAPAARYLTCADLYVLCSSWESLPIGVLEAMACGVPQVVTHVGGIPEAVASDTAILVPPRDPEALAQAIIPLVRDGERRRQMGRASRIRHAEAFSVSRMLAQTAAVYEAALAGRAPAARPGELARTLQTGVPVPDAVPQPRRSRLAPGRTSGVAVDRKARRERRRPSSSRR
jgi:glycosyltransferase involved in cell wall biosynthesis